MAVAVAEACVWKRPFRQRRKLLSSCPNSFLRLQFSIFCLQNSRGSSACGSSVAAADMPAKAQSRIRTEEIHHFFVPLLSLSASTFGANAAAAFAAHASTAAIVFCCVVAAAACGLSADTAVDAAGWCCCCRCRNGWLLFGGAPTCARG